MRDLKWKDVVSYDALPFGASPSPTACCKSHILFWLGKSIKESQKQIQLYKDTANIS